jgi:hypothetical protein
VLTRSLALSEALLSTVAKSCSTLSMLESGVERGEIEIGENVTEEAVGDVDGGVRRPVAFRKRGRR